MSEQDRPEAASTKLRCLPVQVVMEENGLILRRGCTQLKVTGEGAFHALQTIFRATTKDGGTPEEICKLFQPSERPIVEHLLDRLVAMRFLVPVHERPDMTDTPETSLEIFYWHFGQPVAQIVKRLNNQPIVVLGVNLISRRLAESLRAAGFVKVKVVDEPLLRNLRLFDDAAQLKVDEWSGPMPVDVNGWDNDSGFQASSCLVAASDFGDHQILLECNQMCVQEQRHFLPVVLRELIGYVGPLVVSGETACYECLRSRQRSNLEDPGLGQALEEVAFEGQGVTGFHPSMASILGDLAALELTKFYSGVMPAWNVGRLIEVNFLTAKMVPRKVLKIPRCQVCSPLNTRVSLNPGKSPFSPLTGSDA